MARHELRLNVTLTTKLTEDADRTELLGGRGGGTWACANQQPLGANGAAECHGTRIARSIARLLNANERRECLVDVARVQVHIDVGARHELRGNDVGDPLAGTPRRRARIDAVQVLAVLWVHIDRARLKGGRARSECRDDRALQVAECCWVASLGREQQGAQRSGARVLAAVNAGGNGEARTRLATADYHDRDLRLLAWCRLHVKPAGGAASRCGDGGSELHVHARIMTGGGGLCLRISDLCATSPSSWSSRARPLPWCAGSFPSPTPQRTCRVALT